MPEHTPEVRIKHEYTGLDRASGLYAVINAATNPSVKPGASFLEGGSLGKAPAVPPSGMRLWEFKK